MILAVGGLIRDRVPELRIYLKHLRQLDWPDVRWLFLLDNCQEEADGLVVEAFPEATIMRVRDGGTAYSRDGRRPFARMALLRGRFMAAALQLGVDGVLSIDSDIVVVPDLVRRLVEVQRPWVCALVDNSRGKCTAYNLMWLRGMKFYRKPIDRARDGPADLIGAACFYRRDLLDRVAFPVRERGAQSEDAEFALAARGAGFGGWYVPLELEHLMIPAQTQTHLARCAICAAR